MSNILNKIQLVTLSEYDMPDRLMNQVSGEDKANYSIDIYLNCEAILESNAFDAYNEAGVLQLYNKDGYDVVDFDFLDAEVVIFNEDGDAISENIDIKNKNELIDLIGETGVNEIIETISNNLF